MIEVVGSQDVVIKNLSITDGDHGIAVFGGSQRTRIENVEFTATPAGYGATRRSLAFKLQEAVSMINI